LDILVTNHPTILKDHHEKYSIISGFLSIIDPLSIGVWHDGRGRTRYRRCRRVNSKIGAIKITFLKSKNGDHNEKYF